MKYDSGNDFYTCRNNKKLMVDHLKHSKGKTGNVSEKTVYRWENCSNCPYKRCKKSKRTKKKQDKVKNKD